eukprot:XP_025010003.1 uncharacterized protein LOC112533251 isoform X2 [Gallus gallus]
MQQQEGFFLNLLHEEGAVKVTVHWEVDEWSPAGGVAAEDEHPGSFTAGAMTLALFSAGNENHLLSLNRRSFSDSAHLAGMANSQQHGSGLIQGGDGLCSKTNTWRAHSSPPFHDLSSLKQSDVGKGCQACYELSSALSPALTEAVLKQFTLNVVWKVSALPILHLKHSAMFLLR